MIGPAGFVVVALAAYRLARLVAVDDVTVPFRNRLWVFCWDDDTVRTDGMLVEPAPKARSTVRAWLYDLLTCPVCIGLWLTAGLYVVWRWIDWMPVHAAVVILAAAGVQTFLATRVDG